MTSTKRNAKTYAIGYVRVSTEQQAESGLSVEAQEAAIRAHCDARGLQLMEIVVDAGVSGGLPLSEREGGQRVVAAVKAGLVSVVVATKLDRLFRSSVDCLQTVETWDRRGVALNLLDLGGQALDTASTLGRFFLSVMAAAAKMERGLVRDRTKAALRAKRARGEYTGGRAPFGMRSTADGRLEPCPEEQAILAKARTWRDQGLALAAVAEKLTLEGDRGRTGRPFSRQQVHTMLETHAAE